AHDPRELELRDAGRERPCPEDVCLRVVYQQDAHRGGYRGASAPAGCPRGDSRLSYSWLRRRGARGCKRPRSVAEAGWTEGETMNKHRACATRRRWMIGAAVVAAAVVAIPAALAFNPDTLVTNASPPTPFSQNK